MKPKITQNFSISFSSRIWKLHFDAFRPYLFLELRDELQLQTTFAYLDINQNKLIWDAITMPENWWIGVWQVQNGVALFYQYNTPEIPESKGIQALKLENLQILWEKPSWKFLETISESEIVVWDKQSDQNETFIANILDGKISKSVKKYQKSPQNQAFFEKTLLPFSYYPENDYFSMINDFSKKYFSLELKEKIDYLEHKNWIILSIYVTSVNKMSNFLWVLDSSGNKVLDKCLASEILEVAQDTFFILEDNLYFIENQNTLSSFRL